MRNAGLEEAQAGIKIAGRNISNLRYADDPTLMAESEEELKSLLMKVKEESENVGLKLNSQKTKIMASGSITSWQIDRETVETVSDFIFLFFFFFGEHRFYFYFYLFIFFGISTLLLFFFKFYFIFKLFRLYFSELQNHYRW